MDKENIQKELFEFKASGRQSNGLRRFFQKADLTVSLSAERMVFVSIGIIMLLVVSFALGVEKGKTISAAKETTAVPVQAVQQRTAATNVTVQRTAVTNTTVRPVVQVKSAADNGKPYMVVAASYLKEPSAIQEVNRLKGNGLEAFVYRSGPYYLVCVGSFTNRESAQKILNKVRQTHRDAYVRLK